MNLVSSKKVKLITLISLVLLLSIFMAACSKPASNSEVIAEVNDLKITKEEFYDFLVEQNGAEALQAMILEKMLEMEIKENKIEITNADIDTEYAKMAESYGGIQGLESTMMMYGYSPESIKKNIRLNLSIEKLMEPMIEITDEEIVEYYEENKEEFGTSEQVKASHILVATYDEAADILGKIDAGESFEDLAAEYSLDASNAGNGGDLGFFGKGAMVTPFEDEAFRLGIGEVSAPVETNFGYHIIKVFDKKPAQDATLEEATEEIKDKLKESKMSEAYRIWYSEVQDKYKVVNHLDN